jgi:uncharacterized protein YyaL (SSP411 family)
MGELDASDTRALAREITANRYVPNVALAMTDPRETSSSKIPLLQGRHRVGGAATAFVCERFTCKLPVSSPEALAAQIEAERTPQKDDIEENASVPGAGTNERA